MQKCIFLDRDGVINTDNPNYVYKVEKFELIPGVIEALQKLKKAGYLLVIITNQSGIAKGIYTKEDVFQCYDKLQQDCDNLIDKMYYAPYHPNHTESLTRKPDSLMFEKAIAKFNIDINKSFMVGDKERDLVPAKKLNIKTILVDSKTPSSYADHSCANLIDATKNVILK